MSKFFNQEITKCMECKGYFDKVTYKCKKINDVVMPMRIDKRCSLPDYDEIKMFAEIGKAFVGINQSEKWNQFIETILRCDGSLDENDMINFFKKEVQNG